MEIAIGFYFLFPFLLRFQFTLTAQCTHICIASWDLQRNCKWKWDDVNKRNFKNRRHLQIVHNKSEHVKIMEKVYSNEMNIQH